MAIAFRQGTTGSGTTNTVVSNAFGSPTLSGGLIVLTITDDSGDDTGITIADTTSNTWSKIFQFASTSTTQMWYAANIVGATSHTVAVIDNNALATRMVVIAQEFSGVSTTSPLDQYNYAFNTGTAVDSSLTATTTVADELVVAGYGHGGTGSAFSLAGGFTNQTTVNVANAATGQSSTIVAVTGTYRGQATIAASRDWVAGVATFKIASAGASNNGNMFKLMY